MNTTQTTVTSANTAPTTVPTVNKAVNLTVPVPVAVIFKRDPAGNRIGVLKDSLSFKDDSNGTVSCWFEGRGNETSTMPKTYYDKCDRLSDVEVEVMVDKFKAAFNLPYIEVKSRLGKDLSHIKAQHTGASNTPNSVPQQNTRRSTDAVLDPNEEFKLKMQMVLEILPNAVAVAMAQAMQTAVIPAIKSAIDTTIGTVMGDESTAH